MSRVLLLRKMCGNATTYTFKPQLKTVGPKYGQLLNQIRTALSEVDGNAAMDTLEEKGELSLNFGDDQVVFDEGRSPH